MIIIQFNKHFAGNFATLYLRDYNRYQSAFQHPMKEDEHLEQLGK